MSASPSPDRCPALAQLLGARVERVDIPQRGLLALTLYLQREKCVLLAWFSSERSDLALSVVRPTGDPASAFTRRLRVAFEHARIDAAEWHGCAGSRALALRLTFARSDARTQLIVDFDARFPNLFLLDAEDRVIGAADERAARERFGQRPWQYGTGRGRGVAMLDDHRTLLERGQALMSDEADGAELRQRKAVRTSAVALRRKVARREQAIAGDVARADDVPSLRSDANLILCHLAHIPRGAAEIALHDESEDPPVWRTLKLDPARDANGNATARFERARKIERGMSIARARLAEAQAELVLLDALLAEVDTADLPRVAELAEQARIPMADVPRVRPRRATQAVHVAYRTFTGGNGRPIYVGKGGADNDTLTLKVARPFDLWLHARSIQGAHVVIPGVKGTPAPAEQVLDAAHLAAHFSDARGELTLEIQIAERRHLRKPKGAAPGLVLVDRERVLVLRVEPARLQRLLASELKPT